MSIEFDVRAGVANFGRASVERRHDGGLKVSTHFLLPDNTMFEIFVEPLPDGSYELNDAGGAYEHLDMHGMTGDRVDEERDNAAIETIFGFMDRVLTHGCGLYRRGIILCCKCESYEIAAGLATLTGASLEVAALIYPWQAGLLRGGGLPDYGVRGVEGRRFEAALTGADVRRRMDEMNVRLAKGADMSPVLDEVQRALDYGVCAEGAAVDRDKALADLLERGVLRVRD